MTIQPIYIDIFLIIFFGGYIFFGIRQGFVRGFLEFSGFLVSLFGALKFYVIAGSFLVARFPVSKSFSKILSFVLLYFLIELLYFIFVNFVYNLIPEKIRVSKTNHFLGGVSGLLKSMIAVAISLTLLIALPLTPKLKTPILNSKIGGALIKKTTALELAFKDAFGGVIEEAIGFFTIKPLSEETVPLDFKAQELTINEASELKMLELVNIERQKAGLKSLTMDLKVREVARAHSRDMFVRQYFAHNNPDGLSPFDRLGKADIYYISAGENLALAPSVELAHQGLMNSPGHRANILSADFGKVGIGVIDGGVYGKMFTQNFRD